MLTLQVMQCRERDRQNASRMSDASSKRFSGFTRLEHPGKRTMFCLSDFATSLPPSVEAEGTGGKRHRKMGAGGAVASAAARLLARCGTQDKPCSTADLSGLVSECP